MRTLSSMLVPVICLFAFVGHSAAQDIPKMKFNEVREVAPGVFFRFASISPVDKSVFGGCNNTWVVFKDFVLVYDANFPKEAGDVIKAVRKTTDKPIKFVLDSHHHGDHAYGNAVWLKEGATIIGQRNCVEWLRTKGAKEFSDAGKGPTGRKDIADSFLKIPDIVFDDKLVFDDGKQRAEILFFGHCHTPGDAVLYLPKYKILCTGDACVNGAYNFMGHSNSASWIKNLEKMQQLDIKLMLPGHGSPATKELLAKQRKYFVELRKFVQKGIDEYKEPEDIVKTLEMPWYEEWTGVAGQTRIDNVKHVYAELTGATFSWELVEDFEIYEGPSPTRESDNWTKPKRIVVPNLMMAQLYQLKRIAPEVLFIPVKNADEAAKEAKNADAVLGFASADILKNGKQLRWLQVGYGGINPELAESVKKNVVVTDVRHISGTDVSEQAFAMLLALTRNIQTGNPKIFPQPKKGIIDLNRKWNTLKFAGKAKQLYGKNMLIVGFGGVGRQIAKRANAFGMRVTALTNQKDIEKPAYVFSLRGMDQLNRLLPKADIVVLACGLNHSTKGILGAKQFDAMKPSAYLMNVSRNGLVDESDLINALKSKQIAGAGLDVTDPTPLANNHPFWKMPNVVISPQTGGQTPEAREQQWKLWRENVRRFVEGERLLCVVE